MYKLFIELSGLPKIQSNGSQGSWRGKHFEKKKWSTLVINECMIKGLPAQPLAKAKLTLTRFSSMEPDFDGLVISFKSPIDSLTKAGIIQDDKPSVIGQPTYKWVKAKPGAGKITILVVETE